MINSTATKTPTLPSTKKLTSLQRDAIERLKDARDNPELSNLFSRHDFNFLTARRRKHAINLLIVLVNRCNLESDLAINNGNKNYQWAILFNWAGMTKRVGYQTVSDLVKMGLLDSQLTRYFSNEKETQWRSAASTKKLSEHSFYLLGLANKLFETMDYLASRVKSGRKKFKPFDLQAIRDDHNPDSYYKTAAKNYIQQFIKNFSAYKLSSFYRAVIFISNPYLPKPM